MFRPFNQVPSRDSARLLFIGVGIGEFCANAGWLASGTFIALYAQQMGVSIGEIGLLVASYYLVSTIMTSALGKLSDVGRLRKVFIVAGLAGCAVAYWFLSVARTYGQLLFLWGLVLGIVDSAHKPASSAIIAEFARQESVGRHLGTLNAFIAAGMAVGSLIGGGVADLFGLQFVFTAASIVLIVGGVSSFVVLGLSTFVPNDLRSGERKRISKGGSDARFILASGMLLLCVDVFLRNCGFWGVTPFLSVYLAQLGAGNTLIGLVNATNFFAQILFMPMMGWVSDKAGTRGVFSVGAFGTTLAILLLSIVGNPLAVFPIMVIVAFSFSSIVVASNAFAADVAPQGRLGEMMGMILTSMNLGGVVGPAVAGAISEMYDLGTTFRILALFPLLSFFFSIITRKSLKNKLDFEQPPNSGAAPG